MYTHKISWTEFHAGFGCNVSNWFRTTEDAIEIHLKQISADKACFNIICTKL